MTGCGAARSAPCHTRARGNHLLQPTDTDVWHVPSQEDQGAYPNSQPTGRYVYSFCKLMPRVGGHRLESWLDF